MAGSTQLMPTWAVEEFSRVERASRVDLLNTLWGSSRQAGLLPQAVREQWVGQPEAICCDMDYNLKDVLGTAVSFQLAWGFPHAPTGFPRQVTCIFGQSWGGLSQCPGATLHRMVRSHPLILLCSTVSDPKISIWFSKQSAYPSVPLPHRLKYRVSQPPLCLGSVN